MTYCVIILYHVSVIKKYSWCQFVVYQNSTALRQVHENLSTSKSSGQKIYTEKNLDPYDLFLKVKAASSSTVVGPKGYRDQAMTFGRQNAVTTSDSFVDFPHAVTALDVYKVLLWLLLSLLFVSCMKCSTSERSGRKQQEVEWPEPMREWLWRGGVSTGVGHWMVLHSLLSLEFPSKNARF